MPKPSAMYSRLKGIRDNLATAYSDHARVYERILKGLTDKNDPKKLDLSDETLTEIFTQENNYINKRKKGNMNDSDMKKTLDVLKTKFTEIGKLNDNTTSKRYSF